ncbi:MAG: SIMPL domain-containing protein [Tepidiformaceae bacterium]
MMSDDREQDGGKPPLLTVRGSAEVLAAPDVAVVRLGVEAQTKAAADAQQQANEIARAILDALIADGVKAEAVRSTGVTLSPIYTQPGDRGGEPKLAGYRAQNVVAVRVTDMERVGPVLDAGLSAGANRVDGIQFSLRDDAELRRQALSEAIQEARTKAETMSAALGVTLAGVHAVEEGDVIVAPVFRAAEMRQFAMEKGAPTPVSAGQVTVSANVMVQYRISGAGV